MLNSLNGAIEHAKVRVYRNYKTAIPQWYNDNLQLLLPLCFVSPTRTDMALCVRKDVDRLGKASYVAKTALTLPMAYSNARLITKPDSEWLCPQPPPAGLPKDTSTESELILSSKGDKATTADERIVTESSAHDSANFRKWLYRGG